MVSLGQSSNNIPSSSTLTPFISHSSLNYHPSLSMTFSQSVLPCNHFFHLIYFSLSLYFRTYYFYFELKLAVEDTVCFVSPREREETPANSLARSHNSIYLMIIVGEISHMRIQFSKHYITLVSLLLFQLHYLPTRV